MDWRDAAPAGRSSGEAREGSPRQMANDYQLARLAMEQVEQRRGGVGNREYRQAAARAQQIADEIAATLIGIREAGGLLDGLDRREAPQATRPKNSTIRSGWVKPIAVDHDEIWHDPDDATQGTEQFDLAKARFNAKMSLLHEAIGKDLRLVSDPYVTTVKLRVTARTVPRAMYHSGEPGYGSYLGDGVHEIHWYEEPGEHRYAGHEGGLR